MPKDSISSWVAKAKSLNAGNRMPSAGTVVIRREEVQTRGNVIMEIAEKIRPFLLQLFKGIRDESGMLYQPAHIRGIALNMAQDLLKKHEANDSGKI